MKDPRETALRYLAILNLIPRLPGRIATPTLQQKLSERGFDIDLRSLQRDLKDKLSLHFPLICHDNERPYRWSFTAGAHLDLPALNTPGALTLYLAEEQLRGLLPQTVADQLKPQFDAARKHLQHLQDNGMAHWAKSVRAMPNGKALLPAEIPHDSWHNVTEALLHKKQLQVVYLSRASGEAKTFRLHPYGLVSRYSSSYLVARSEGFEDLRHYALHRIQQADVLAESAITDPNFDIDAYIETGTFARRLSPQRVELVADIHPQVAWLLNETPLSKTQQILPIPATEVAPEGWQRLVAIVTLDKETLWWIYAMNNQIRLHAPQQWVDEIRHTAADLNMFYQAQPACDPA
ncbi:helix-turn-helix transcriptional regulator [Rheinheimera sp.]|uniref:helix-turn-helix transcriptional regulator n=1 Tax=Rheinheimera sp. TaxID=1869214 RepID=UPI004048820B